jgi:thiosulfate/3-mercaptopyruvate sulfurtransferase
MLPDGPFVETEWLAERLGEPQLRIVDIRGLVLPPSAPKPHYHPRHADYAAAHVPGAVYVDWTKDIIDADDPVPSQVAPAAQIAALMGGLGIGDAHAVVIYDDWYSMFAGRLLWVLRYYGFENARILHGGMVKWLAEGRPVSADVPTYAPAVFTPRAQPQLRRTADQVLASLDNAWLIDARSEKEYRGLESRVQRAGHIPGAQNVFYQALVSGPNHTYLPVDQLQERFRAAGIDPTAAGEHDVVAYCNGGVSATPAALAFELASGGRRVAIYDGSWNEWGADESKPLEV